MIRLKDILKGNDEHDWMGENLNEAKIAKLDDKVADLYAWAGIKDKYDDEDIKRFGKDVVDRASKMATKVIAYKKKIKQIAKDIQDSDEGKILIAMMGHAQGYGGSHYTNSNVGDLFNNF